jgi:hypothetical protein
LVNDNESLQRLYKEKEQYEDFAYTWSPEPICLDVAVMSLRVGYGDLTVPEINVANQVEEQISEAKKVAFDDTEDENIPEKEVGKPKKIDRGMKIKSEKKKYRISRWRDEVEMERRDER